MLWNNLECDCTWGESVVADFEAAVWAGIGEKDEFDKDLLWGKSLLLLLGASARIALEAFGVGKVATTSVENFATFLFLDEAGFGLLVDAAMAALVCAPSDLPLIASPSALLAPPFLSFFAMSILRRKLPATAVVAALPATEADLAVAVRADADGEADRNGPGLPFVLLPLPPPSLLRFLSLLAVDVEALTGCLCRGVAAGNVEGGAIASFARCGVGDFSQFLRCFIRCRLYEACALMDGPWVGALV
mmetsp:Transcript_18483/g.52826  ORF Transcript_18483/g.52826 Transcript_18483/m.52826 type:complete len:247 (+) Transcript_18483:281-1021(+)